MCPLGRRICKGAGRQEVTLAVFVVACVVGVFAKALKQTGIGTPCDVTPGLFLTSSTEMKRELSGFTVCCKQRANGNFLLDFQSLMLIVESLE